jgi:hypothetical protein
LLSEQSRAATQRCYIPAAEKQRRNYNVIKRLFGEHVEPRSVKTYNEVLPLRCIALNNMHRMTNLVIMVMISASTIEA